MIHIILVFLIHRKMLPSLPQLENIPIPMDNCNPFVTFRLNKVIAVDLDARINSQNVYFRDHLLSSNLLPLSPPLSVSYTSIILQ